MLICTLPTPITMLFFGYRWRKKPPKEINTGDGYRTRRSMSSKKAWNFAHAFFRKLWLILGWVTLVITIVVMAVLAFFTTEVATVGFVGGIIVCLQMIPLIAPIFTTERALKREFGI